MHKEKCHLYAIEYYSDPNKDTSESFVGKWKYLETIILSGINQANV